MKPSILRRWVLTSGMAYAAAFYVSTSVGARQAAPGVQVPAAPPQLADTADKALVLKVCGGCHDAADKITQERHSDDRWAEIVSQMFDLGMKASEDNANTVLGYLKTHYGCVPKQQSGNFATRPCSGSRSGSSHKKAQNAQKSSCAFSR